jgi:choline dehydrogenase
LKAHTQNTAGSVSLRSNDPRDVPDINFRYFNEGNDAQGRDMDAVVDGIEFVRKMNARVGSDIAREVLPGPQADTREKLATFARDEAWGHHASCTNKLGPDTDAMAVVDGRFRVRGVKRLRVVDASIFPAIPGFFIVTPVYMISEKATDVILADAAAG